MMQVLSSPMLIIKEGIKGSSSSPSSSPMAYRVTYVLIIRCMVNLKVRIVNEGEIPVVVQKR